MARYIAPDDPMQFAIRRDLSGGMNTRQHEQIVAENQAVTLENVLLETAGSRTVRPGQTRIDSSYPSSSGTGVGLFGFEPDGGTAELLAVQLINLHGWAGGGSFSSYSSALSTGLQTTIIKAGQAGQGDIVLVSNGTDEVYSLYQDHTFTALGDTTNSPPKTTALAYYGNRVWGLKSNLLYFSDAYPSTYSTAFDRVTGAYTVPVGTERALIGTRDQGLICIGKDEIWRLIPSYIPAATDYPERVLDVGCVAGNTAVPVGDDIFFLAPDGVRGLFRTQLDKLQTGESFPLSYMLKDQYDNINWAQISKACAVYFDNKYVISLPTGTSTYNNECWVYYPALKAWCIYSGWEIARFAKLKVSGQERLYGIDAVTGQVYQLFYGTSDSGTAVVFNEISRAEDYGQPLQYKMGGEFKIRTKGGNGTLVISANPDGVGWTALGTMSLALISDVTFPTTFPMIFGNEAETSGTFHLDDLGIIKFKRVKFKIYCNTLNAAVTILESVSTAFVEEYISED